MVSGRVVANKNREPLAGVKVMPDNLSLKNGPPLQLLIHKDFTVFAGYRQGNTSSRHRLLAKIGEFGESQPDHTIRLLLS